MTPFAILPPMPLTPRLILGLLGTLFAGLLNLVFCGSKGRARQFVWAFALSPAVILGASMLGLNSGQRTDYVFLGAVVGIVCVRGTRPPGPIPAFGRRALVVFIAFIVLGPLVGLAFHWLRYQAGYVALYDDWEIQLSLEDGFEASIAGSLLAGTMVLASALRLEQWAAGSSPAPRSPTLPEVGPRP
jgi:hypothetical protein